MTSVYYIVEGCDWHGDPVTIDGKIVSCDHKHRSEAGANACISSMRRARIKGCSVYKVVEISLSMEFGPVKRNLEVTT